MLPGRARHDRTPLLTAVFDGRLRAEIAANLAQLDRWAVPLEGRRHAAVAVVVVDSDAEAHAEDPHPATAERLRAIPGPEHAGLTGSVAGTAGGPAVLLTRRATRLQAHAGQWALPGGRVEPGEDPLAAARRELHEELGLDLAATALVGLLDDYPTRSGYVISPFVFWGGADPVLHPDPSEVRSVHRISFRELCRPDSPRFVAIPESDRPVVQLPVGGDLIHAPTGAILLQFRRVAIEGVLERVADYEQPVFAWR
jgi:8-oxo-dGTP pyrophosphatase MutT (NUDIX family)